MPIDNKNKNSLKGTKIKAVPKQPKEIGIDLDKSFQNDLIDAAETSSIDISALEGFNTVAQTREQIYTLIDTMAQDSKISSILETYAEDVVEPNDKGQIVWCEADDANVMKYVNYLLESLDVDKHIYKWAYNFITYGDLYLRLYRESDYNKDPLFGDREKKPNFNEYTQLNEDIQQIEKDSLKEDIRVNVHANDDHYVHYVEMVPNPGEMFELTRLGKTQGYIQASIRVQQTYDNLTPITSYLKYKLKQKDIIAYDATDFVHACLDNSSNRVPETVDIYSVDKDYDDNNESKSYSYTVKKGQSILYNSFRIWRELSLLENSVLLNRLTKSAIVRILNVDVGDMPKSQIKNFLARLKDKIEQKSALNVNHGMQEYTNPGAIENIIYIPTHGTQGQINASTIGGDVDPKSLIDLDYFQNNLYGSLRVPKQFFGLTDDAAGFNGGSSLSIISSRYGKSIKRIQNQLCQMITDLVNLLLYDKGLMAYINKFKIRMQTPITQEEIDRRTNKDQRIRFVGDLMNQLNDVENTTLKLKILKSLLTQVVNDDEVLGYIQEQIDQLEEEEKETGKPKETESSEEEPMFGRRDRGMEPFPENEPIPTREPTPEEEIPSEEEINNEPFEPTEPNIETIGEPEEDSYLPNPEELGFNAVENQ